MFMLLSVRRDRTLFVTMALTVPLEMMLKKPAEKHVEPAHAILTPSHFRLLDTLSVSAWLSERTESNTMLVFGSL